MKTIKLLTQKDLVGIAGGATDGGGGGGFFRSVGVETGNGVMILPTEASMNIPRTAVLASPALIYAARLR